LAPGALAPVFGLFSEEEESELEESLCFEASFFAAGFSSLLFFFAAIRR